MSNMITLQAASRDRLGKGAARAIRRQDRIPAIVYGGGPEPEPISISAKDVQQLLVGGKFMTSICSLSLGDRVVRTIPRDIHFDPVRDFVSHIDFQRLKEGDRINVSVPFRFLNMHAGPGIKRGGVINIVAHEVLLHCLAEHIPDHLEVDLANLEIGHAIHVSDVALPVGVELASATEQDMAIATVVPASGSSTEETPSSQS